MATRTIFFHVSPLQQVLFYALALVAIAVCAYGFYCRYAHWCIGKPVIAKIDWRARAIMLWDQVMAHRRIRRRKYAGSMHAFIFFGMFALFIGTCIVAVEHYGALLFGHHWLYKGAFYIIVKLLLDLFGVALLIGTAMALI